MAEYLPNEWKDEERMSVLMGAMPLGRDSLTCQSRLNFWSSAIHKWVGVKKIISFTLHESELAFQRGSQVPLCLQDVFFHMLKKGDMIPADQLLQDANNSWLQWTKKNLLILPSQWAWRRLKEPFSNTSQSYTIYLDMLCLKGVARNFLDEYWSTSEKKCSHVTPASALYPLLSKFLTKTEDHNLLLQYLSAMGNLCHTICDGQLIVKIVAPLDVGILPISDIEIAEYRLKSALEIVKDRIQSIINEISSCREDAKSLLKTGLKKQACNKIKRKQILERNLDSLTSTQDNLMACIDKLMEAEINREVVGAFRSGLNAIKKSISSGGSYDSIEDTLDNLREVMEECNDVTGMISSATDSVDVSEEDLEKELETLMENIDLNPPVEKPTFPSAPTTIPAESKENAEEMEV